jgi:hypothetical protein
VSLFGALEGLTLVGTSGSGDTVTLTHRPDGLILAPSEDDGRIT